MQTVTETIDVKKAKVFLENNPEYVRGEKGTNRPVSARIVNNYAATMLQGNWHLTHQGIGFDVDGKLKDGQHRLKALVQAGESGAIVGDIQLPPNPKIKIQFQVTYGLPKDIFPFLDNGFGRNASTSLALAGYANGVKLASAARIVFLFMNYEYKHWPSIKVTPEQILETTVNFGIDNYIGPCHGLIEVGMIHAAGVAAYCICEQANPEAATEEFIEALVHGDNLRADDARHVFRNYLIRSKRNSGIRRDSYMHLALFIKTWNDWLRGIRRSNISWKPASEPFPRPLTKDELKK